MTNFGPNIADMQNRFKILIDKKINAVTNKTLDTSRHRGPWHDFINIPKA